MSTAPRPSSTPPSRWTLAALSLGILLPSLGTSIANVALPALAHAFGAPFQAVQWVVLAYLLANTTLVVGAGRLGDLLGRRRLLVAGIALFTTASALCGLAPGLGGLVAARAVQGLGAAMMTALAMALVGAAVPRERTGSAMGLLGTMSAVGTALGPSLGGLLLAAFGWRAIFLVNVPLGLAALALARRHLPADRPAAAPGQVDFDKAGTLALAVTLGAYALAMTIGRGRLDALNAALLAAAVLGAALFAFIESRARSPLVQLARLRDPAFGACLAMGALVATVMMATLVVGPFHLARALGLGPALVGLAMSAGPLVSALTSLPAGRLVDRLGPRHATLAGLLAAACGCAALAVVPAWLGVAGYVGPLVVVTLGYALFQAANNTAVMADVPADRRGVVSGLLNLSRNLGLVTGASAMGAVFAHAAGTPDLAAAPPEAVAAGTHATFAVAAALVVLALGLALASEARGRRALSA